MAYVGVVKALYDYAAQDPEDELSFSEDQILYVVEKGDDDWWKAQLKLDDGGMNGPVGLIPCTYVEEIPPINSTKAMYAYTSTEPEELSMEEDAVLHVYAIEDEWILVSVEGGDEKLGFVPRNYCEDIDESNNLDVAGGAAAAADVEQQRAEEEKAGRQRALEERMRELRLKDKVETWAVAELDGKKKKKGTLGVGNGAIFFASEADKSPVKQYPIADLSHVEPQSDKVLVLTLASAPEPLQLHTGSSKTTKAIVAKLESSKEAAGEALELTHDVDDAPEEPPSEDETPAPAPAQPKTVRWAESTPASPDSPVAPAGAGSAGGAEQCIVLYDFEAGGDDELTVTEGEELTVVEKEDEWWLVRNAHGAEGVVPAQYVEVTGGGGGAPMDNSHGAEAAAASAAQAAAAAEASRREEAARKEEERRAIEQAARERAEQEEADHELAMQVEREEREKRMRVEAQVADERRRQREAAAAQQRKAARGAEPPQVSSRGGADITAAARNLPSGKSKSAPQRPTDSGRPKPNPARTRVWSDRSGQFKVEAEFLGMNGNKLRLHKMNGVIIEVPMEKMSSEDSAMIRKYLSRKGALNEDDVPLAKVRKPSAQMSHESAQRGANGGGMGGEGGAGPQRRGSRRPAFDWFAFFLEAGCDMDDCTRYAANFDRDRIDESILPDLDATTLRSLGLREGDVIRVRKVIQSRYAKKTPEQQAQLSADEEYARKLQEHEDSGAKGPAPAAPPGLFTNPDGKLSNNTRRGRPDRRNTLTTSNTVDTAALAAASEKLSTPMEPAKSASPAPAPVPTTPMSPAPPPPPSKDEKKDEPPKTLLTGFDDDAWTIKPTTKAASTSPAPPTPSPGAASPTGTKPANGTDALLAQIQSMRPASTDPPKGGNFDVLAGLPPPQQASAQRANSMSMPPPSSYGLGTSNTNAPMGQLQQQNTAQPQQQQQQQQQQPQQQDMNAPRGPLAPVRANEGLLNPLQPSMTGMFVPTHPTGQPQQQQGYMGMQQTGMMSPGGYGGYGGQQQQPMQPAYTGMSFGQQQQPLQGSAFNAIANLPPPQIPQATGMSGGGGGGDKFAPSSIFSAMKRTDFSKPEEQNAQPSQKYDALRPLTTGYNGAPGMYPQQTGMMQMQQTGMPMGGGMGGGMNPGMGMGMMTQMTGYNPQMGQMGGMGGNMSGMGGGMGGYQQNPYGY